MDERLLSSWTGRVLSQQLIVAEYMIFLAVILIVIFFVKTVIMVPSRLVSISYYVWFFAGKALICVVILVMALFSCIFYLSLYLLVSLF